MPSVTEFEKFYVQMGYKVHEVQVDGMGEFTIWIDRPMEAELLWRRLPQWAIADVLVHFKQWAPPPAELEEVKEIRGPSSKSWVRRLLRR